MPSFGFSTLIDGLSWLAVVMLAGKFVATALLLIAGKDVGDRRGWCSALWWVTKITPVVAILCFISIAALQDDDAMARLWLAFGLFVLVVVLFKIYRRRLRLRLRRVEQS